MGLRLALDILALVFALRLGNVTVRCTMPLVYIGFDGEALDGGELYAKRVIQAHRQRVVDQAVS